MDKGQKTKKKTKQKKN